MTLPLSWTDLLDEWDLAQSDEASPARAVFLFWRPFIFLRTVLFADRPRRRIKPLSDGKAATMSWRWRVTLASKYGRFSRGR
jgi:hypothetical protein